MPRSKLSKETKVYNIKFVSSDSVNSVLETIPKGKKSEFIRDSITSFKAGSNSIDTIILKKLIPAFIENGIKLSFEPEEISRLEKLIEEVYV